MATSDDGLDPWGASVLAGAATATRTTVDSGVTLVSDVSQVAGGVPLVGQHVVTVVGSVVSLAEELPVVGGLSSIVPLPIGGGTPTDVVPLTAITGALGVDGGIPRTGGAGSTAASSDRPGWPGGRAFTGSSGSELRSSDEVAVAPVRNQGGPRGPWAPVDSTPVVPTQPAPTGGTAQGAGDPATTTASVVLPHPSTFGRSSADWRVPRGLPAHPGTRPD